MNNEHSVGKRKHQRELQLTSKRTRFLEGLLKKQLPAYRKERKTLYKEFAQIHAASRNIILADLYKIIFDREVSREWHRYDNYWKMYRELGGLLQQIRYHPLVLKVPDIVLLQPTEYLCEHNRPYKNCITLGPLRSGWVTAQRIAEREESLGAQFVDARHMKTAKRYRIAVSCLSKAFRMKTGERPKDFSADGFCSSLRFSRTGRPLRSKQFRGWLLSSADEQEPSLINPRRARGAPAADNVNRLIVRLVNTLSRHASGFRWTKTKALGFTRRVLLYFLNEDLSDEALIQRYKRTCRKRATLS